MKKINLVLILLTIVFTSCKTDKYPDLKDGMYATIDTKYGDMLIQLEFEKTPMTVANFVSLAEGTNDYVSEKYKGKPFYNGLKFHRVLKDFMIQGGDPLGTGSGGPGYKFKDEFDASLVHDKAGILSMANPGLAANGSQFFITHKATPWLNNRHTVFGHIIKNGQEIVNVVVKDDVINKITIIRKGASANAFNATKIFNNAFGNMEEDAKKIVLEKEKQWQDITDNETKAQSYNSGLKMFTVKKGNGEMPKKGQTVTIHYTGYFKDGKIFDTSITNGKPLVRKIGIGQLIQAWDEGVVKMKVGEKAIFYVPAHLAYGTSGIKGVIPPNSDMIFEVELLSFK